MTKKKKLSSIRQKTARLNSTATLRKKRFGRRKRVVKNYAEFLQAVAVAKKINWILV